MQFDLAAWGAELTPERPAVWSNGRWLTYRDLNERANGLANQLASLGIGFGDRVGLLAGNHLAHFDLMFAAAKIGFIHVPFDPQWPAARLGAVARTIGASLVISDLRHETLAAQAFSCPRVDLEEYREWLGYSSRRRTGPVELSPESIQSILFTRGPASDEPHAVLIPYRQALANARVTAMTWGLGPEDCALQVLPCAEASIHLLAMPLLAVGGRVVLPARFEAEEYLHATERLGVTAWALDAPAYAELADHAEFADCPLQAVRHAFSLGTSCSQPLRQRYLRRGVTIKAAYVRAECGPNVFALSDDDRPVAQRSVGLPMSHVDAQIRRADGRLCGPGEPGELSLAGEGLCAGYYDSAEAWHRVCREGRFHPGERAEYDAAGFFHLLGTPEPPEPPEPPES